MCHVTQKKSIEKTGGKTGGCRAYRDVACPWPPRQSTKKWYWVLHGRGGMQLAKQQVQIRPSTSQCHGRTSAKSSPTCLPCQPCPTLQECVKSATSSKRVRFGMAIAARNCNAQSERECREALRKKGQLNNQCRPMRKRALCQNGNRHGRSSGVVGNMSCSARKCTILCCDFASSFNV